MPCMAHLLATPSEGPEGHLPSKMAISGMNLCINGKYDNPQIVLPKQIPPFLVNGLYRV